MGIQDNRYFINGRQVSEQEYNDLGTKHRDGRLGHCTDSPQGRPFIEVNSSGVITHNGEKCRVVLRRGKISVGCSDISPEALKELVRLWDDTYPCSPSVVVVQE